MTNDSALLGKAIREQFNKLILESLLNIPREARIVDTVVILVDVLDECEQEKDIRLLISLFSRINVSQSPRLRIFLTSRPELPVRLGFEQVSGTYQDLILHEIHEPVIAQDLAIYFRHELAKISKERRLPPSWPSASEIRSLVDIAVSLFISASTVCRFLADRNIYSLCPSLRRQNPIHGIRHL
jgi:hypothetical protein